MYSLAPVIFRATPLDQWAITHSLNEWLLLSQANILVVYAKSHRFPLNYIFGTLIDDLGSFPFDHGTYLPQSDSCFYTYGIRSLIEFGNLVWPLAHSVLYPHMLLNKASPKTISRRTSYIRVRLEFLRYPQVIPRLFNAYEFGPPLDFTQASACSWIGHPVSGLFHMTFSPFSDSI